jgi:hypothetical protein
MSLAGRPVVDRNMTRAIDSEAISQMHYRQWRLQDTLAHATAIAGIKPNL